MNTEQPKKRKAVVSDVAPLSYNVPDAAKALGISRRSIYNLLEAGKLRRVNFGRRVLIPAADLRAVAEGRV